MKTASESRPAGAAAVPSPPSPTPAVAAAMPARDRPYADRAEAGRELAAALARRRWERPVVLALPRGGLPVAVEVARALRAPLDLLLVRKIGAPFQTELAVAAVARLGEDQLPQLVTDPDLMRATGADRGWIEEGQRRELLEIARRRRQYLGTRAVVALRGCTAIVVDDGLATGTTARAAVLALRHAAAAPARVVLAVPVAPARAVAALAREVDELVCLWQPQSFHAVGAHYRDFRQVDDAQVAALLAAFDRQADHGRVGEV
jgi:putative phosphoribosyl transferase